MDEESGFLSYRGIMISAQHYDDAFHTSGADYEAILLQIPGIESFGREYGMGSRRQLTICRSGHQKKLCRHFRHRQSGNRQLPHFPEWTRRDCIEEKTG